MASHGESAAQRATEQIAALAESTAREILEIFSTRSPSREVRAAQLHNELIRFALKVSILTADMQDMALEKVIEDSGIRDWLEGK